MRLVTRRSSCLLGVACLFLPACSPLQEGQPATTRVTVFEGARLITGDGSTPIESSAFVVENNQFTRVGRQGELPIPAGAARVDLTGKTVMPAMVDVHSHLGFLDMADMTMSKDNFTRANLIDQLGTVASGKSADFIVLEANPLDSIANTRKIAKVYLRGQEVDRTALRARWQGPANGATR